MSLILQKSKNASKEFTVLLVSLDPAFEGTLQTWLRFLHFALSCESIIYPAFALFIIIESWPPLGL